MVGLCLFSTSSILSTEICLVALGAKPARKYSASGVMMLPVFGEVPPSRLYYKEGNDWKVLRVNFNRISTLVEMNAEGGVELFRKSPQGYEKYLTLPAIERDERVLVFLMPSADKENPWTAAPHLIKMPLDEQSLEGKDILVKNLSSHKIRYAVEDTEAILFPMKTIYASSVPSGKPLKFSASYSDDEKLIFQTSVERQSDEFVSLYVLYNTNPETNFGREVAVMKWRFSKKCPSETKVSEGIE